MNLIEIARDTLKGIPMADILRERLSLALDRLAQLEIANDDLKAKLAVSQSKLEAANLDVSNARDELQKLKAAHEEEIRVHNGVEFRRGKRTGGTWQAFCPACHTAADATTGMIRCAVPKCEWTILLSSRQLDEMMAKL